MSYSSEVSNPATRARGAPILFVLVVLLFAARTVLLPLSEGAEELRSPLADRVSDALDLALLLLAFGAVLLRPALGRLLGPIFGFLFICLVCSCVSILWARGGTVLGNMLAAMKLVLPWLLYSALLPHARERPLMVRRTVGLLSLLVLALGGIGAVVLPAVNNRGDEWRGAYFGGLHATAYYWVSSLFVLQAIVVGRKGRLARPLVAALSVISGASVLALWGVRSAALMVLVQVICWVMGPRRVGWISVLVAPVLVVGALSAVAASDGTLMGTELDWLSSGRLSMYSEKWNHLAERGFWPTLFGEGYRSDLMVSQVWWWGAKGSHSDFLTFLTEYGLVGSAALMWFAVAAVRFSGRQGAFAFGIASAFVYSSIFSNGLFARPLPAILAVLAMLLVSGSTVANRDVR